MAEQGVNCRKVMLAMSPTLVARADDYASKLGISRSAFFSVAVGEYLEHNNVVSQIPALLAAVDKLEDISQVVFSGRSADGGSFPVFTDDGNPEELPEDLRKMLTGAK